MIYQHELNKIAAVVAKINLADRRNVAEGLADVLNPFDRAKFFEACCITPPRFVVIHVILEPITRMTEQGNAVDALQEVAEMIGMRGVRGVSGCVIYIDGNEIGHVTTETGDA